MMNESDSHDEQQLQLELELEENPSSAENSLMDDSGVEEEASQQNQTPNVVDLDKSDPDYEIPNAALTAIQQPQQPQQQQNTDLGNFPFRELLAFFRVQMNAFVANFNPGLLLQSFRLQAQAFLFRLFHNKPKLNMLENRRINNKSICSTAQSHQKQEHPSPNCLTLSDLPALEEGVRFVKTDIRQRWQFYQPELAKKPAQRQAKPKSKTLVCSRQLFAPERTHSRQGQCSRESMVTMGMDLEEDDDLDSISTTSGIFTPCSTIEPCHGHPAAENSKLNTIEQQLASLQKQMALLLQQKQPEKQQVVVAEKPKAPPAPPPPAPPLPPSLKADLARAAHKPMPDEQAETNGGLKKKSPSPTSSFASSNPTAPAMGDLLQDIRSGNVKLKKVRRSSNGDLRARKKTLTSQNDGSVAGVLIRALGERRKKMKLDSDTGDGLDDSHRDENGDDAEEEWRVEEATAEAANGNNASNEDGKENNDSVFIEGPSSI